MDNPGKHGPRAIQQQLKLSSSSLAAYHLNRLLENQLIEKNQNGQYYVSEIKKIGRLQDSILFAGKYVPRIYLYAVYAVVNIIFATLLLILNADPILWFFIVLLTNLGLIAYVIFDANSILNKL